MDKVRKYYRFEVWSKEKKRAVLHRNCPIFQTCISKFIYIEDNEDALKYQPKRKDYLIKPITKLTAGQAFNFRKRQL